MDIFLLVQVPLLSDSLPSVKPLATKKHTGTNLSLLCWLSPFLEYIKENYLCDIAEYLSCSSKVEAKGNVEDRYFGPSRNEDTLPSKRTLKASVNKKSVRSSASTIS